MEPKSRQTCLINFDFDGVIADTFDHLLGVCRNAQQEVGAGRPVEAEDLRTLENLTFAGLADRLAIPEELWSRFAATAFEHQRTSAPQVSFFPGMVEVLRRLHGEHMLAIITSGDSLVVRGYLQDHGVAELVPLVAGGETGRPKAESIQVNMSHYAVGPEHSWMIGDAVSDIRQGKAAGVGTIAVCWGFQDRRLLANESPDFLAETPEELLAIVRSI